MQDIFREHEKLGKEYEELSKIMLTSIGEAEFRARIADIGLQFETNKTIAKILEDQHFALGPLKSLIATISEIRKNVDDLKFLQTYADDFRFGGFPFSDINRKKFIQVMPDEAKKSLSLEVDMEQRIISADQALMKTYVGGYTKIQSIIKSIKNKTLELSGVTHSDFEDLMAELLKHKGFEIIQGKKTRDGGVDMVAMITDSTDSRLKYLVQCKHKKESGKKVDVRVIREFKTVITEHSANKGLIISSTGFTKDARTENDTRQDLITLKEYSDIIEWIIKY